ncbi:unnamed protein product [Amoebophrya sp. A120]|nr:unnamed protein product [Amoebophrya sp. A120]|eukprot:GSA120T00022471001.1
MMNRMKSCGSSSCATEQKMVAVVAALLLFVALQPVCGVALSSAQRRTQEGSVSGLVQPQGNGSAPEDYLVWPGGLLHGSLRRAIATFGPPRSTTQDCLTPTSAQHSEDEPGRESYPEDPSTEPQREPVPPGWASGGLCFGCGSPEEFKQELQRRDEYNHCKLPIMFVKKIPGTSNKWSVDKLESTVIDLVTDTERGLWSLAPPGRFKLLEKHWIGPLKIQRGEKVRYVMIFRYLPKAQKAPEALKWIKQDKIPAKITVSHALVDSHYVFQEEARPTTASHIIAGVHV